MDYHRHGVVLTMAPESTMNTSFQRNIAFKVMGFQVRFYSAWSARPPTVYTVTLTSVSARCWPGSQRQYLLHGDAYSRGSKLISVHLTADSYICVLEVPNLMFLLAHWISNTSVLRSIGFEVIGFQIDKVSDRKALPLVQCSQTAGKALAT